MSIVVRFRHTNPTTEVYDESVRRLQEAGTTWPPDGLAYPHLFGSEVSEIWDSQEQLQAFGEKILADIRIEFPGEPEIFEVRKIIRR